MAIDSRNFNAPGGDDIHVCKPGDINCWSRIGVTGNRTCPELAAFIHCRNCPVFSAAAQQLFNRPAPEGYLGDWAHWLAGSLRGERNEERSDEEESESHAEGVTTSVLVFRLGMEWLAFRTQTIAEVTTPRPIHTVPHRTNNVFLGLANLQGQVQLCVSLHGLFGAVSTSVPSRLVVLHDLSRGERWAFPADEVLGVRHVPRSHWCGVPATLINPTVGFSEAVLSWKKRSIGLLDESRVFNALRSLEL